MTSCRRHLTRSALPSAVRSATDALAVIHHLSLGHPGPLQILLLVDPTRAGRLALPMTNDGVEPWGPGHAGDLVRLTETIIDAADDVGAEPGSGLILATYCPGRGVDPEPEDLLVWERISDRALGAGMELLDWFFVDPPRTRSMAEVCGSGWPPG